MARPSLLTPAQWADIEKRYLSGEEKGRALAREFGISEAAIRKRFGTQCKTTREVAKQLAEAEVALAKLPISARVSARSLADELRDISLHLASAARHGSATAQRLASLANDQAQKLDDAEPTGNDSARTLVSIVALTKAANEASEIGLRVLGANRNAPETKPPAPPMNDMEMARRTAFLLQRAVRQKEDEHATHE